MAKPYIILHMLTSIEGDITGDFLSTIKGESLCEEYYKINRNYKADAYLCGRVTMEGSFTKGIAPDLTPFKDSLDDFCDYVAKRHPYYAVAIDPHGRLNWESDVLHDEDVGYDNAHIIEVITKNVPKGYTNFLKSKGVSYIVCGEDSIDVEMLNNKLVAFFGINKLMLEGGGLTDALFLDAGVIDELSLVVCPFVGGEKGKPLFTNRTAPLTDYKLFKALILPQDGIWLNYKKNRK